MYKKKAYLVGRAAERMTTSARRLFEQVESQWDEEAS